MSGSSRRLRIASLRQEASAAAHARFDALSGSSITLRGGEWFNRMGERLRGDETVTIIPNMASRTGNRHWPWQNGGYK